MRNVLNIAGVLLALLLLLLLGFALEDRYGISPDSYLPFIYLIGVMALVQTLGAYLGCRFTRTGIRSIRQLLGYTGAVMAAAITGFLTCMWIVSSGWLGAQSANEALVGVAFIALYFVATLYLGQIILKVKAKDSLLFFSGLICTHVGAVVVYLVIVLANIAGKCCR